jgi:hypothetical protein
MSVVESMSVGLIPVVPEVGVSSEFVPKQYHYSTFKQAVEVIRKVLSGTDCSKREKENYMKSEE